MFRCIPRRISIDLYQPERRLMDIFIKFVLFSVFRPTVRFENNLSDYLIFMPPFFVSYAQVGGCRGGVVEFCLIKPIITLTLKSSFCLSVAGVSPWSRNALQVGIFLGMRASVH